MRRRRTDEGQAALELVGFVVVLVITAALCVQGVFLAQTSSAAQQAARDGARAYALGLDIGPEVRRALPSWAVVHDVRSTFPGDAVRVEVSLRARLVVPGVTTTRFVVTRDAVMPRG